MIKTAASWNERIPSPHQRSSPLPSRQPQRLAGLTTKTGSAAASNESYLATRATPGNRIAGTKTIRLITATKTVLFSPGWVELARGCLIASILRCKKLPPLPFAVESDFLFEVDTPAAPAGAGGL